jgi:cyanate permease
MGGFSSYIMGWLRDLSDGDFSTSIAMLIFASLLGVSAYVFTIKKESTELHENYLPIQKTKGPDSKTL